MARSCTPILTIFRSREAASWRSRSCPVSTGPSLSALHRIVHRHKCHSSGSPLHLLPAASFRATFRTGGTWRRSAMLKVIEVLAESKKGWDDAAQVAVTTAAKTVRGIRSINIDNLQATVD